jgi:hypothetical protein
LHRYRLPLSGADVRSNGERFPPIGKRDSQKNASLRQVVDFLATQSKPPGKFFAGNKVAFSTPHNRKVPEAAPLPLGQKTAARPVSTTYNCPKSPS